MIKFENYSIKVKHKLSDAVLSFLYELSGEIVSQTARRTRVDTGQLKGSWRYKVDDYKGEAIVGSPLQNAIWEEFGTGRYAEKGNGRKTPWYYVDRHGDGHFTHGKKPNRAFWDAYLSVKPIAESRLSEIVNEELQ